MNQVENGKAFEFSIAKHFAEKLNVPLQQNSSLKVASSCYIKLHDNMRHWIDRAADESTTFLLCHDKQFEKAESVYLQEDRMGVQGDVRDILLQIPKLNLGISAKHNHKAVKHSRLSNSIDFGKEWTTYSCNSSYFKAIQPVFADLTKMKEQGMFFRDIAGKEARIYLPVLTAFEDELKNLCENYREQFVIKLFKYLLGKFDFYKVIRDEKIVFIQSMNMDGTLGWGKKWKVPAQIENIKRKRGSNNTLLVSFTGGWQLSFRIHSAKSKVEPSLKFDIQFIGLPQEIARHEINLET